MQENNFEKQVQQMMEALSFTPSAPVWQKVEAQIKRKKDRRRVVLWMLPLLLLTGGVVWWQYGFLNKEETAGMAQGQQVKEKTFKNPYSNQQATKPATGSAEENILRQQDIAAAPTKMNVEQSSGVAKTAKQKERTHQQKPLSQKHKVVIASRKQTFKNTMQPEPVQEEKATVNEERLYVAEDTTTAIVNESIIDKIEVIEDAKDSTEINKPTDSLTNPAPVKLIQKSSSKWRWEVYARAGISGVRSELANVFASPSLMDFAASPGTGSSAPLFGLPVAKTTNGGSFSLGASVKRKVGSRSFVTAGLQYSYYSMHSHVGAKVSNDTASSSNNSRLNGGGAYYRSNSYEQPYRTRYHYVELPVAFEYQLFKKLPLHLQQGISVGQLISNNALYYDRQAGIYYAADHWLRKTGVNLFTSIDYRLVKTERFSVLAGPQLQWGLTPLQKTSEVKKQHLFFTGIRTRIAF